MDTIIDSKLTAVTRTRRTYTEAQRQQILDEAPGPEFRWRRSPDNGINDNVIFT